LNCRDRRLQRAAGGSDSNQRQWSAKRAGRARLAYLGKRSWNSKQLAGLIGPIMLAPNLAAAGATEACKVEALSNPMVPDAQINAAILIVAGLAIVQLPMPVSAPNILPSAVVRSSRES
jgi:hypothetical protein